MIEIEFRERPMHVLIITYVFPPSGGVGAGRSLKLVKYLPTYGVKPTVLTVSNPSVPLVDNTLSRDVDPGLKVIRARTLEPSYSMKKHVWANHPSYLKLHHSMLHLPRTMFSQTANLARQLLIPDPQVMWLPDAHRALGQLLLADPPDVVFITAPPFSLFLLSLITRLRPQTAVVFDYRDEWTTLRTSYKMLTSNVLRNAGALLERVILRFAHVITTATEAFRHNLLYRFPYLNPERVITVTNGYDPDDFPVSLPSPPTDRFVATYAGTVHDLTTPRGFLQAVRLLHERSPELAKLLEVHFIGRVVATELEHFEGMDAFNVHRLGFVPKEAVMPALAESHLVLCIQGEFKGAERIYPAKIFELLHLGRPCLTLSPRGVLTELVENHRCGVALPPNDIPAIAAFLEEQLRLFRDGKYQINSPAIGIERFHRREIAGEFVKVFRLASSLTPQSAG
jgi:glycosyltransferase involved in cell wall biosynthesis